MSACCYVLKPDNMTCATETPLIEIDNNASSIDSINLFGSNSDVSDIHNSAVSNNAVYGDLMSDGLVSSGGLGINFLNRIYHLVIKTSVIGSKIDEYLRAHNISRGPS